MIIFDKLRFTFPTTVKLMKEDGSTIDGDALCNVVVEPVKMAPHIDNSQYEPITLYPFIITAKITKVHHKNNVPEIYTGYTRDIFGYRELFNELDNHVHMVWMTEYEYGSFRNNRDSTFRKLFFNNYDLTFVYNEERDS